MKAAVQEQANQPMTLKDVPDPSPGPGEVLVRVKAAGVCHTDIHIADNLLAGFGIEPFPVIMGHEIVGVVEQVGDGVSNANPGDRVGLHFILACGNCPYCQTGEEESCPTFLQGFTALGATADGGYAQYVKAPADRVVHLPEQLDFADAAPFCCAGLTMYGGFKNAGLQPGMRAAVLGIGGLGHLAIPIAKAMGAEVIAITSTESKGELARQLGASQVIAGAGSDSGQKLMEIGGANVVLSTTVDGEAIVPTMQGLLPQGTLVLTGVTLDPIPIVPMMLIAPQHRVIGSILGSIQQLREVLQLAVDHNFRPMTEIFPLEEANAAHDKLRANQVRFRAVLTPS